MEPRGTPRRQTKTTSILRPIMRILMGSSREAKMRRRTLLGIASFGLVWPVRRGAWAQTALSSSDDRITVRLELPRESLQAERALAGPDYSLGDPEPLPPDPNAMDPRFVEPVTLIAAVTIAVLAERIVNFLLAKNSEGVLINMREDPPRVSNVAGIPQGFILLVHPEGRTETIQAQGAPETVKDLIAKTLSLGRS